MQRKIVRDNNLFMVLKRDKYSDGWAKIGRKYDTRGIASYCVNCAYLGINISELSLLDATFLEPYIRKGKDENHCG
jgi:hypothetical protein